MLIPILATDDPYAAAAASDSGDPLACVGVTASRGRVSWVTEAGWTCAGLGEMA
jgi:hypothetical protein